MLNIENRGEFYPASIRSMSEMKKDYAKDGFWTEEWGLLVIVENESGKIAGQIAWFKTVQYMTELELGYIMFDTTARTRGGMTEACKMLTRYLFDTKTFNRIRLCIATENGPSRRVAEKSGYKHEGTQRGAWWNRGPALRYGALRGHARGLHVRLKPDVPELAPPTDLENADGVFEAAHGVLAAVGEEEALAGAELPHRQRCQDFAPLRRGGDSCRQDDRLAEEIAVLLDGFASVEPYAHM
jgi:RimJ/RimL family protein N-acetyltransferase